MRDAVVASLRFLGFDVITAETGAETLRLARGRPFHPSNVTVSRPSAALEARAAAKSALNGLFLGHGSVALLVGGVRVANIMIISVLERRSEIGCGRGDAQRRAERRAGSSQLVGVRGQQWVVSGVVRSHQPAGELAASRLRGQTLVRLTSVSDDDLGEELTVVWEVEPRREIVAATKLPEVRTAGTILSALAPSMTRCAGAR